MNILYLLIYINQQTRNLIFLLYIINLLYSRIIYSRDVISNFYVIKGIVIKKSKCKFFRLMQIYAEEDRKRKFLELEGSYLWEIKRLIFSLEGIESLRFHKQS